MSIRDVIKDHVRAKRLWVVKPMIDSDPTERTLLISPEIKEVLDGPWPSTSAERRCGELQADLETFVKGERISACLVGFQARDAYLGVSFHQVVHPVLSEEAGVAKLQYFLGGPDERSSECPADAHSRAELVRRVVVEGQTP